MLSANIIEPSAQVVLKNNINLIRGSDQNWCHNNSTKEYYATSAYGCINFLYETPIRANRLYYYRCSYKYALSDPSTGTAPSRVLFYEINGQSSNLNITPSTNYVTASVIFNGSFENSFYADYNTTGNTRNTGNIYHLPYKGVTGYGKNVLCYDVTDLYTILSLNNIATTESALKTWCDNNLEWQPSGILYNITNKISVSVENAKIKGSTIYGEVIEGISNGLTLTYTANEDLSSLYTFIYSSDFFSDYSAGSESTRTYTADFYDIESPFYPDKQCLKIEATATTFIWNNYYQYGGFYIDNCVWVEGCTYKLKIIAKVPSGYYIRFVYNNLGSGGVAPNPERFAGTGKYEEYTWAITVGTTPSTTIGPYIVIETNDSSKISGVTWYIAYCYFWFPYDNTTINNIVLNDYCIIPGSIKINGKNVFTYSIDSKNLFANGNGSDTGMKFDDNNTNTFGWDTTNVAGNAKASIIQNIKTVNAVYPASPLIPIDPTRTYKISFWLKGSTSISNLYFALLYYTSNKKLLKAYDISYVSKTKTYLTADLISGATEVTVNSNANWVARKYSQLGFRTTYRTGYCDLGTYANGSTGIVNGTSGTNTILLNKAYSGSTIKSGTTIVEAFDESTYKYLVTKNDITGTWQYVNKIISNPLGDGGNWDGDGGGWQGIPYCVRYISFMPNIMKNDSSEPIYVSDFRIEEYGTPPYYEQQDGILKIKRFS